jgi:hypothetical protein
MIFFLYFFLKLEQVSVVMFFIPFCLMSTSYALIGFHVWSSRGPGTGSVEAAEVISLSGRNDPGEISVLSVHTSSRRSTRNKVLCTRIKKKVFIGLEAVLCMILACWLINA